MSAPTGYITADPDNLALFVPGADPADQTVAIYDFIQDGLLPGGRVLRRQIAESMYMDDASQVHTAAKAQIPTNLGMFVTGYSGSNLQDNVSAFCDAIDADTWELHVTLDGAAYAWTCWKAEWTPGFPVAAWYGFYLPIQISTFRSPIPVGGPI